MGTISATFHVNDDIDPAYTDPMELIEEVIDPLSAVNLLQLVEAEWLVDDGP